MNFLSTYLFQEYQDKCSSAINEVKIDLLSNFTALLLRSVQNQKTACNMHNFKLACKKSASDNAKLFGIMELYEYRETILGDVD